MAKKATSQKTDPTAELHFEAYLNALENRVEKMESGQLSLEDSLKNFEEGIVLARKCQKALKEAEQKVHLLVEKNGELQAEPFAVVE